MRKIKKTRRHFWQSRNKSDKKHNLRFDPLSCFFLLSHWLALIVLHSHVMPSSLPWRPQVHQLERRCCRNVCQRPSDNGRNSVRYLCDCRGPGFRFDWTPFIKSFIFFFFFFPNVEKRKLTGALVCFFCCQINIYTFFFFCYRYTG